MSLKDHSGDSKLPEFRNFEAENRIPPGMLGSISRSKIHMMYKDALTKLCMASYRWEGLEPEQANMIEWCLFNHGSVGIVKSEFNFENETPEGMFVGVAETNSSGIVDWYGRPLSIRITGYNGKAIESGTDNFVIGYCSLAYVRNSPMVFAPSYFIDLWAEILTNAFDAWRVAAETNKTGEVFFTKSNKETQAVKHAKSSITANNPVTVIQMDSTMTMPVAFKPSANTAVTEFHLYLLNTWSAITDLIGVESSNNNKKERVSVKETNLNQSLAKFLGADGLEARQLMCDKLSEFRGRAVTVKSMFNEILEENDGEMDADNEQSNNVVPRMDREQ